MARPPFRWNPNAARYTNAQGRFVARTEVRHAIDTALESQQRRMRTLSNELRGNRISIGWWQREMRSALKDSHIYSAAAARGGFAQMSQSDYGRVGQRLRQEYTYLDRLAGEIEAGLELDGTFLARTGLYAQGGRSTYHEHERLTLLAAEFTECRSLLGAADHCGECVSEAGRDWVPIMTSVVPGERQCLANCHCSLEYR